MNADRPPVVDRDQRTARSRQPAVADFDRTLDRYVRAVAREWGIGAEFCVIDAEPPAWAYLPVAWRLPRYPGRDLALLWDERSGWSLVIETDSSQNLIVVAGLGEESVVPAPSTVHRVVDRLTERGGWVDMDRTLPHRAAGRHGELTEEMVGVLRRQYRRQSA